MPTVEVARALGLGVERVRQLDEELMPHRRANGRRYYYPRVVEEFLHRRGRK